MNRATLTGHLGRDPEVRRTQSGKPIVNMSLATTERWRDKNTGERKEATEWHRIVIFNEGLAGIAEQYLRKGSKVLIEGKIKTRKWTDQSGVEKYSTEIVLENFSGTIEMLDSKGDREGGGDDGWGDGGGGASSRGGRSSGAPRGSRSNNDMDDDIPF